MCKWEPENWRFVNGVKNWVGSNWITGAVVDRWVGGHLLQEPAVPLLQGRARPAKGHGRGTPPKRRCLVASFILPRRLILANY